MDERLQDLLARANAIKITPEEREQQTVLMAAANGNLTDQRITVATVEAARTIMRAADEGSKAA